MEQLKDRFGRNINYIRISVTDRCNFRCIYCMPEHGIEWMEMNNILTYEDIEFFMKSAAALGIKKVKLTGGEPLARKDIAKLVEMLKGIEQIKEISLTTNGSMLTKLAKDLKKAGLDRITVSLDTLNEDKFRTITRLGSLSSVLDGFDALDSAGFENTKINTVIMKGINVKESVELAGFALSRGYDIRFIELMPTDFLKSWRKYYASIDDVIDVLKTHYDLEESSKKTNGPAVYYKVKNGFVGFITPLSKSFCGLCNRIRLSSDGYIIPCLGHNIKIDAKEAVRARDAKRLKSIIKNTVFNKPKDHALLSENIHTVFSKIGG